MAESSQHPNVEGAAADAKKIKRAERRLEVLELRKAGATYTQISKALDISLATVSKDLRRALQEVEQRELAAAEDLRALDLGRLDALLRGVWPAATSGDVQSVKAAVTILERRARMLGIDAPKEHAVGVQTWTQLAQAVVDLGEDPDRDTSRWLPAAELEPGRDKQKTGAEDAEFAEFREEVVHLSGAEEIATPGAIEAETWVEANKATEGEVDPTALAPMATLEADPGGSWLEENPAGATDPHVLADGSLEKPSDSGGSWLEEDGDG